ncbi:sigma-E factor regulatory protein RseB domain-containing protein [Paraburkholderia sp. JHI869]|uniref:sigma-E factor regulatory protein RseB domain-containing protein n=1 Tax=Paraburkholderia sp. JHI869 TaxID=3112959 RepID=UPI00316FD68A
MTLPDRDFVAVALTRFDALTNYQVTLKSTSARAETVEVLYGYRKPGFVRMDFMHPHAGATLTFNPESGKVKLWPFGIDTFPRLTLSPDNPMIQSPQGHRVDQSDIGALLANVRELEQHGDTQVVGAETIGTREAAHVIVTCRPGHLATGVFRYELWFDVSHGLPVKVVSEGESREPIETVMMENLRIDVPESQLRPFG